MAANNYQFFQTRKMFREYLSGYPEKVDYNTWLAADNDSKASLLYVTFYQEVTLAWYNAIVSPKIVYISQEDGVSTVLQYLMKNVDKIAQDPERYSSQYIYRVCYNCLLSLWRTRGTENMRCACEVSPEYVVEPEGTRLAHNWKAGQPINLWDLFPSDDEDLETQQTKEAIWNIIRHMGPKAEKVVNHLINPDDTLHRVSSKSTERANDRLADVSVSKSEYDAIVAELRVKLAPYKDVLLTF